MKQCTKCGQWKTEQEFSFQNKLLRKRKSRCKDCLKSESTDYYRENKESLLQAHKKTTLFNREKARGYVWDYLSHHVCVDCGEYDPMVLEFDHVRGEKRMSISQMVNQGYSIEKIRDEIYKCEVVCGNCHKRREKKRRGTKYW